jgi:hypothetical protein
MTITREEKTLDYEEHSALFWSTHLGRYGGEMSAKANAFAVAAAGVSALTGAAVWTTLTDSTNGWAQAAVTMMAVVAAVLAIWPKQYGYTDCATQAAALSDAYAKSLVQIRQAHDDLDAHKLDAAKKVSEAQEAFRDTRKGKDLLRPFPRKLQDEIEKLREEMNLEKVE